LQSLYPKDLVLTGLKEIAAENNIYVLAGLFEKDREKVNYTKHMFVSDKNGLVASFRKLASFYKSLPDSRVTNIVYLILMGWKCGILICYDNNISRECAGQRLLLGEQTSFLCHMSQCAHHPHVPGRDLLILKLMGKQRI
jgi:predicted amidohydrolase